MCPRASSDCTTTTELSSASLFQKEGEERWLSSPHTRAGGPRHSEFGAPHQQHASRSSRLVQGVPQNQACCQDITNSPMLLLLSDGVHVFILLLFCFSHKRK